MTGVNRVSYTNHMISQWDALATLRKEQIESGEDITYIKFLIPRIEELIGDANRESILDAGCGVGFLTRRLTQFSTNVTGIDPSSTSISLAIMADKRINYLSNSMEEYARDKKRKHDLIVANMVLMDVLDLSGFLLAAYSILPPGGELVFSITHPWFWPIYAGYSSEKWYKYTKETIIEAPFSITRQNNGNLLSTHVHRPLDFYFREFHKAGFEINTLTEPMPDRKLEELYPRKWEFPRYLFGILRSRST